MRDEFIRLVDALTVYMGRVDLVLIASDDSVLYDRLRKLHVAREKLVQCIIDFQRALNA